MGAFTFGNLICSAVDHFKKQFAYLEEHYGKGGTISPLDRQHASLPRYHILCYEFLKSISFFFHCVHLSRQHAHLSILEPPAVLI
jgi:hypothetical protein